jgi:hypothetical protein
MQFEAILAKIEAIASSTVREEAPIVDWTCHLMPDKCLRNMLE